MLILPVLILAQATFFSDTCRAANGKTPAANRRKYGYCAAYNRGRLGDRLALSSRSGRCVRVTVTDRGGMGRDVVDLRPEAFAKLAGPGWISIGRLHGVTVHLIPKEGR